jgi:hypothetical protein
MFNSLLDSSLSAAGRPPGGGACGPPSHVDAVEKAKAGTGARA